MSENFRLAKSWAVIQGRDVLENLMRDLKSLKALWNYMFLALYTWVCCYCVLYHAETCANTVIMTTGGLVGTIFTGYIWASNKEKQATGKFPAYVESTPRKPLPTPEVDNG